MLSGEILVGSSSSFFQVSQCFPIGLDRFAVALEFEGLQNLLQDFSCSGEEYDLLLLQNTGRQVEY